MSVLGGMLIDSTAIPQALALVDESMFFLSGHRPLFVAMLRLHERRVAIDPVTLTEELRAAGVYESTGGAGYLSQLLDAVPTAANIEHHAQIVRDKAAERRAARTRQAIARAAADPSTPPSALRSLVEGLEQALDGSVHLERALEVFRGYGLTEARAEAGSMAEAVSTGFVGLDTEEFFLSPGKVYAVAARPSEGKTTLLLELLMRRVEARAQEDLWHGGPAVFVTYEENLNDIYLRLLLRQIGVRGLRSSGRTQVPPRRIAKQWLRDGKIADGSSEASLWASSLATAAEELDAHRSDGRLVILDGDRDGGDVDRLLDTLRSGSRALGAPPSLLIVDYFQKVRPPRDLRGGNRQEQLQEVADLIRRFAKGEAIGRHPADPKFATPVVAGAQVNRETVNGQPELHHVREADDLANDAAGVLTLWRPMDPEKGGGMTLHVKVVKNRDGRRDRELELPFYGEFGHVGDTSPLRGNGSGGRRPTELREIE